MCEQIVEKLNSNPVFAMSLHSKELFLIFGLGYLDTMLNMQKYFFQT